MKYAYIYIIVLIVILQSCEYSENNKTTLKTINLNGKINDELKISNTCSEVDYIKLETNNKCLIGRIQRLIIHKNKIYILDSTTNSIFVFNMTGNFEFKINNVGKGSGQYTSIREFAVNEYNKTIDIYDERKRAILVYDLQGKYIETLSFKIGIRYFFPVNKDTYLVFTDKLTRPFDKKEYANDILIINKKGKVFSKYFPYIPKNQSNTICNEQTIMEFNNEVYVNFLFRDTIFFLKNNKIIPKYYVDYGKNRLPEEYRNITIHGLHNLLNKNKYSFFQSLLGENERFILISFIQGKDFAYALYNKKTNETKLYKKVINDFNNLPFVREILVPSFLEPQKKSIKWSSPLINIFNNNTMYGYIYPHELGNISNIFPITNINDNPIILMYKIR